MAKLKRKRKTNSRERVVATRSQQRMYKPDLNRLYGEKETISSSKERIKRVERKGLLFRLELLAALLLIGFVSYRFLYLSPTVLVEFKAEQTVNTQAAEEVSSNINGILNTGSLSRVKPFLPRTEMEQYLATVPYIKSSSITIKSASSRLLVTLELDKPYATLASSGQEFLLGETGKIIGQPGGLYHDEQSLVETTIRDSASPGVDYRLGDQVLSAKDISFIKTIKRGVEQGSQLSIARFEITESPRELLVYLDGVSYFAKFYLDENPTGQVASLIEGLDYLKKNSVIPREYVDVRLVERVVYK